MDSGIFLGGSLLAAWVAGSVALFAPCVLFPPGVVLDGRPFSYGRLSERKLRRELTRRVTSLR